MKEGAIKRPVGEMKPYGLYDPKNEHDSCGIGFVANIDGRKEYGIVEKVEILNKVGKVATPLSMC